MLVHLVEFLLYKMLLLLLSLQVALMCREFIFIEFQVNLIILIFTDKRIADSIPLGIVAVVVLVSFTECYDVEQEERFRWLAGYGITLACTLGIKSCCNVADKTLININILQVVVNLAVQYFQLRKQLTTMLFQWTDLCIIIK